MFTNYINFREKLYAYSKSYKKFESIDNLDDLDKKVTNVIKRFKFNNSDKLPMKDKYIKALEYLTYFRTAGKTTYDERIAALIRSVDPELKLLQLYRETITIPYSEVVNQKNDELNKKYFEELDNFLTIMRRKFGFSDLKLVNYELDYFKKYIKDKELTHKVKTNYINSIIRLFALLKSFDNTTYEEFMRVSLKVDQYKEQMKDDDMYTAFFNVLFQNSILELKTLEEKLIFLIQVMDKDLKLLTIYEEESMYPNYEKRANEELGFESKEVRRVEKIYHKKFMPNKKISDWD